MTGEGCGCKKVAQDHPDVGSGTLALGQRGGRGPSCSRAAFWGDPHHHSPPPSRSALLGEERGWGDPSEPRRASAPVGQREGDPGFPALHTEPVPLGSPVSPEAGDTVPPSSPSCSQGTTGAGSWGYFSGCTQASLCQPDLFHGYVLPLGSEICLFLKKKKERKKNRARLRGRKGLPEPCEATRLTTWLKGNSPAITQLGEMFSRRGSPTFPRFLPASTFPQGKILREAGCRQCRLGCSALGSSHLPWVLAVGR